MLKNMICFDAGRPAISQYKASAACVTGMGVVVDPATSTFGAPATATDANIFVVDKNRDLSAAQAAQVGAYFSDTEFCNVANGEYAVLRKFSAGEEFATDQIAAADKTACATAGKYLKVGTDGLWTLTASNAASKYVTTGTYDFAGTTLYKILVVE